MCGGEGVRSAKSNLLLEKQEESVVGVTMRGGV